MPDGFRMMAQDDRDLLNPGGDKIINDGFEEGSSRGS